jgi:hypothetical protein
MEGADILDPEYPDRREDWGREKGGPAEHEMTRCCEVVQNGACGTSPDAVFSSLRHETYHVMHPVLASGREEECLGDPPRTTQIPMS